MGTNAHALFGRGKAWNTAHEFRVLIHEWGHYGLDLYDEYMNPSGGSLGAGCTLDKVLWPTKEEEDQQASFMDVQG